MSRIGKRLITIPEKVEASLSADTVSVKGPLGEMTKKIPEGLSVSVGEGSVSVTRKNEEISAALWGTFASHIANMVAGVSRGFQKKLQIEGIGYRAEVKGDKLVMSLGFSHPVEIDIPSSIKMTVEKNIMTLTGANKDEVGSFAAQIRSRKIPEPYKGKGIRYEGEVIKMKQGKKTVA